MIQPSSEKTGADIASLQAMKQELVRNLDALRTELLDETPTFSPSGESITNLAALRRGMAKLMQALVEGVAELDKWHMRYERYLSDEFREEVTAHFHEAKRRALEDEVPVRSQSTEEK